MQVPGISLQTLPKVQPQKDFTNSTSRLTFSLYVSLQLADFKLENANLVALELVDTGTALQL